MNMNTVFYQTRSVTRDSSTSLRNKRTRRIGYLCPTSSDPLGYFSAALDATNIYAPASAPVTPQTSSDANSLNSSEPEMHSLSVTSLLLDNPSDFVVINNVTEERKPEVVTLNGELLNAWNNDDLFDGGTENSSKTSDHEFIADSPDFNLTESGSGSAADAMATPQELNPSYFERPCGFDRSQQLTQTHTGVAPGTPLVSKDTNTSEFAFDFSNMVYDEGIVSFDSLENLKMENPILTPPPISPNFQILAEHSQPLSPQSLQYPYHFIPSSTAQNFAPPSQPVYSFEYSRNEEGNLGMEEEDSFNLPEFPLDDQFTQNRGSDFFSMHIFDLI